MSFQNLEAAIQAAGNPVELLRNSQIGPYAFPVVRHEFTNWRDEQRSWRETCALFDQSHHMSDLYIEGPDALKLLSDLGVNSFKNFKVEPGQAVRRVQSRRLCHRRCHPLLSRREQVQPGRTPARRQLGALQPRDREVQREGRARRAIRRQSGASQRSTAIRFRARTRRKLMEKVTRQAAPDIRFFNMGLFTIANHDVRALRHGMVGQPGWEIFGPWEQGEDVQERDRRRRQGIRTSTGRCTHVSDQLSRVGMDSLAAPGRLHRRRDEGVPAVAEGHELRSDGVARRQLLLAATSPTTT